MGECRNEQKYQEQYLSLSLYSIIIIVISHQYICKSYIIYLQVIVKNTHTQFVTEVGLCVTSFTHALSLDPLLAHCSKRQKPGSAVLHDALSPMMLWVLPAWWGSLVGVLFINPCSHTKPRLHLKIKNKAKLSPNPSLFKFLPKRLWLVLLYELTLDTLQAPGELA